MLLLKKNERWIKLCNFWQCKQSLIKTSIKNKIIINNEIKNVESEVCLVKLE